MLCDCRAFRYVKRNGKRYSRQYNKWKDNHEKMVDHELKKMQHKDHKVIKAVLIGILLALIIEIVYILIINDPQTLSIAFKEIKQHLNEIWIIIINLTILSVWTLQIYGI